MSKNCKTNNKNNVTADDYRRYMNCNKALCNAEKCKFKDKCAEIVRYLDWKFSRALFGIED